MDIFASIKLDFLALAKALVKGLLDQVTVEIKTAVTNGE